MGRRLARLVGLLVVCAIALQLYFVLRIGLMAWLDPQSTTFQRSELMRILTERHELPWLQQWRDYGAISPMLKRAVIASEDAGFVEHSGVEWDAIEAAWAKNQRAEERAQRVNEAQQARAARAAARGRSVAARTVEPRVIGGSTISQQLAKNLFLSGERNFLRKGQEIAITLAMEGLLPKQRILEIYLNNVEWGEGVFGAQAAARHYFRADAERLSAWQAARLAVMLPAPKRFEKNPGSAYVAGRAQRVAAQLDDVELP